MDPLDYMLAVLNDPNADATRRDRMAIAAAPYVHARGDEGAADKRIGKKAAADEAAKTAGVDTDWGRDLQFDPHRTN